MPLAGGVAEDPLGYPNNLDWWTVHQKKARKLQGSFLVLHLARHICEEDSEQETCLTSSHALLTTTISPALALPDDIKQGRKGSPGIKKREKTCYLSVVYNWLMI